MFAVTETALFESRGLSLWHSALAANPHFAMNKVDPMARELVSQSVKSVKEQG